MAVTKTRHVSKKIKNKKVFQKKNGKFENRVKSQKSTKVFKKGKKRPNNNDASESGKKRKLNVGKKLFKSQRTKKKFKNQKKSGLTRGVIYLAHIPHGFYEKEMKQYFSQFGKVTKLKLARSRKTGNMKGYAFIEFECDEVAKIVAETMNNYLMFDKLLKCEFVPPENVHPETFRKGANVASVRRRLVVMKEKHNKDKTEKALAKAIERRKQKLDKTKKKLAELGIEFNFEIPTDFVASSEVTTSTETKELSDAVTPTTSKKDEKLSKAVTPTTSKKDEKLSKAVTPTTKKSSRNKSSSETSISPERTFISNNDSVSSDTLVVDLNDSEITFKTPPTAKKVYKKRIKK